MRRLLSAAIAITTLVVAPTAHGWAWPVDGPVVRPFALAADPYAAGQHRGIDIGAVEGAPVRAPASGTVSFVGGVPNGGRAITILTPQGLAVTLLQLGSTSVTKDATVEAGAAVGTVGASVDGVTTEPHVHLGVRESDDPNGYLDPLAFLPSRPVTPAPPEPAPDLSPAPAAEPAAAPAPAAVAQVPESATPAAPEPVPTPASAATSSSAPVQTAPADAAPHPAASGRRPQPTTTKDAPSSAAPRPRSAQSGAPRAAASRSAALAEAPAVTERGSDTRPTRTASRSVVGVVSSPRAMPASPRRRARRSRRRREVGRLGGCGHRRSGARSRPDVGAVGRGGARTDRVAERRPRAPAAGCPALEAHLTGDTRSAGAVAGSARGPCGGVGLRRVCRRAAPSRRRGGSGSRSYHARP